MRFLRFSTIVLAAAAPAMPAAAAAAQAAVKAPADAELKAAAEALLASAYPADGPGAAAIVMRNGRVLYVGTRGLADVEGRKAITPDTMFKLGSITKQFTAAVILQLVGEGRLSLDDPLSKFFPDWPQPGARATIRQLLNHTSGMQDYSKIPGWIQKNRARGFTTAELVAVAKGLPAKSPPGEAWEYNNGGYVVLGGVIETVAGKPWHQAVEERISRPLGLASIGYAVAARDSEEMVRGYTERDAKAQLAAPTDMSVAGAAGGLVGSIRDIARWAQALHHGRVVSPAMYQEMIKPARLADGSTRPYGFALRLQRFLGRPDLVHGGAGAGLDTDSIYIPSEDLFVAVFANSDRAGTDPSLLTRKLAAIALGAPFPAFARADVPVSAVEPLFGAYSAKDAPPIRFFERNGKLFLSHGEREMEATPAGNDRFFFGPQRLVWMRFARKADGAHVMEVFEPDSAEPSRAVRSGPVPADAQVTVRPEILRSYIGDFATEAMAVTIRMGEHGWLVMQPKDGPEWELRPLSDTEFMLDEDKMRLVFEPENGRADRFTLHRGARQLHGKRIVK